MFGAVDSDISGQLLFAVDCGFFYCNGVVYHLQLEFTPQARGANGGSCHYSAVSPKNPTQTLGNLLRVETHPS